MRIILPTRRGFVRIRLGRVLQLLSGDGQGPAARPGRRRPTAQRVLAHTLDTLLRLLHPVDSVHHRRDLAIAERGGTERGLDTQAPPAESVMIAAWPEADRAGKTRRAKPASPGFRKCWGACARFAAGRTCRPRPRFAFRCAASREVAALLQPMSGYFESMAKAQATGWGPEVTAPATCANTALRSRRAVRRPGRPDRRRAEIARNEKERERLLGSDCGQRKEAGQRQFCRAVRRPKWSRRNAARWPNIRERLTATDAALAALAAQRVKKS